MADPQPEDDAPVEEDRDGGDESDGGDFYIIGDADSAAAVVWVAASEFGVLSDSDQQLLLAAAEGNWTTVEQALQNGANINTKCVSWRSGGTALQLAIYNGHFVVASRLMEVPGINLEAENNYGGTPLFYACSKGSVALIQKLKLRGVNMQHRNHRRMTAFHVACSGGHIEAVDCLLAHCGSRNIAVTDNENRTALYMACQEEGTSHEIVALLLEHYDSEDVNKSCNNGNTPLHMAAAHGQSWPKIQLLLARGARLDEQNLIGKTPLFLAIESNGQDSDRIVQELIDHGADLFLRSHMHYTPFDVAQKEWRRHLHSCDHLLTAYRNEVSGRHHPLVFHSILRNATYIDLTRDRTFHPPMHPILVRIRLGGLTVGWFRTLLQSLDADLIRSRDTKYNGALPIHVACSNGAPAEILQILVELDPATLHIPDHTGAIPVHTLCRRNRADLCALQSLVDRGGVGTLSARDRDGALPLHCLLGAARVGEEHFKLDAVKFLLKGFPGSASMRANRNNTDGDLPFVVALKASCSTDILFELLKAFPDALSLSMRSTRR